MQRVRMSLAYFSKYDWEAEVVMVNELQVDMDKDPILLQSVPLKIKLHRVNAFAKKWTSKIGLGSIALRSLWQYKKKVNALLKNQKFDLIYFSTTQFPVLTLGPYWKKKFNIPYVIDMQDPWHSDYYEQNPQVEKPAKYWFSYRLNKYLEPIAMKQVDGLIAVSKGYLNDLNKRYPNTQNIPQQVITFGAFEKDMEIAAQQNFEPTLLNPIYKNLVYIGRGGADMHEALEILFKGFRLALERDFEKFKEVRFNFLGTSYAPQGQGKKSILPIAEKVGVQDYVMEQTDRIPFYQSLHTLKQADALVIIGSNDPQYTASKIYPYLMAQKPLLALFHSESSAAQIIQNCQAGQVVAINTNKNDSLNELVYDRLIDLLDPNYQTNFNPTEFEKYSAQAMCKAQSDLFDQVLTSVKSF